MKLRRNDLIDMMLDALAEDANAPFDDISIIASAIIFLIAGYDTTAQALSFATFELATHPEIQAKLRVSAPHPAKNFQYI